ncbi:unnamed protein product [Rotaria magnacalcarata]|uniref:Uncharacterized protein n=1 Tax=Rotaria magnacalcarata TaxID=392030 RepID=A0A818Y4Y3_9BILA|nr:unnamed protein product [Rotaria magnacalcarata]CAF3749720.1 unnamed protein product [Rotaria magnacalcarata]
MFGNKSVYIQTVVWNERRFVESKSARYAAQRCLYRAANILLNIELKNLSNQNNEIVHEINRSENDLQKYDEKLQMLDNMSQLATQSLEVYFQTRMENLRTFVNEQCRIIADGIQEEADHWKEIHAMLQQKLVVPGDLRSYGGGNGLPRGVKQSPDFSRILEEEEEEEEEEAYEEEEEKNNDVSILLQARTLTPLITQTLKKARLRASKLSQDTSMIGTSQLNVSTTVHEETLVEESQSPVKAIGNHMTLRDVSAIEKETEMETDITNADLSVSLLQFIPTVNNDEDKKEHNKSICSTISDKTFVKKSLKPITSEDETDHDDDNEDTIVEESIINNSKEHIRSLLLTSDQSIRIRDRQSGQEKLSLSNKSLEEKPKIKQEKVSFREPIKINNHNSNVQQNHLGKTFLLNNHTFDAEKSEYVRPTIIINNDTSRLSPIASAESEEEEDERQHQRINTSKRVEKRSIDQVLSKSTTTSRNKTLNSPLVTQLPPAVPMPALENSNKRRTTRRTIQDSQNVPPQPVEAQTKTRYQTRYSTRLAGTIITEETTISTTTHRRATRLTSE